MPASPANTVQLYTYKNPSTGQSYSFGDPTLNKGTIQGQGLQYVSGPGPDPFATPESSPAQPGSSAVPRYPTGYNSPTPGAGTAAPQNSLESTESAIMAGSTPEDPTAVANRIAGQYASEIAAIRNLYAGLTSQQQTSNVNESGKTRARVAASGELGQDMGDAQQQSQEDINNQKLAAISDEEQAKEAAVYTGAATTAESEIQAEKQNQLSALQGKLTFQESQQQNAQDQMRTVASTYDLAGLPQNLYDSLYESSGFATPEEFNAFYNASRASALTGGKTIGDATTGVWQQQLDGSWKVIVPGAKTIGDPTTGVWQLQSDGTYKNIIQAQPKFGSIGAGGSYMYDPSTGKVQTIKPAANKIVSSGGVVYAIDPTTNKATQLTTTQNGWQGAKGAAGDQEKASIYSYVSSLNLPADQSKALLSAIQSNPDAYYTALGNASQSGFYTPVTVSPGTPPPADTQNAADAAANAAQDATDAAASVSQ